ncbi:hypothetical protein FEM48_Zijuj11G0130200 [Ziziphus jujuba var. spinosa]|uniref:Trafficking protein particle complex subunit 11 domain-containing protein n=1 Tax=Ziziphus jujuba var. spinosa TaxID=714518 RepID=A0A978UJ30_ZIZJJ|nr:hypothetical protein FEM48_Zijuj11G0130200 [Ziziphus jujuba var. spinosa]
MEEYPEELRSPPVSLVAVVGCGELHQAITTHLHSQQPPINSLALPDVSKISFLISPKPKTDSSSSGAVGILKRDWLQKHRTRIPSVIAALFTSDRISGDPAQWLQLCSDLEELKASIRARNIRLVLVVVHSHSKDDITEDRMLALRKRAEVDSKYIITFSQNDAFELKQSLHRLGSIFAELANTYYKDEGRKIKTKIEKKSFSSIELSIRYCFKVAVYAEFRRDWVEALRFYEDAYHALREMIGTSTRTTIQRLVEIKTVAEQLHFKISTLLLHGGKIPDAVTWFRQHNTWYKRIIGSPEAVFLHWEWMSRQFLVFAELLETSSIAIPTISSVIVGTAERPLTEWEFHPAHYYQASARVNDSTGRMFPIVRLKYSLIVKILAAHYLKEKRSSLEFAVSMSESLGEVDSSAESVVPSTYVGQFARLVEQGNAHVMQPLTDDEYTRYAVAEGKRFQDSFEIIALLKKSYESYSNLKTRRVGDFVVGGIGLPPRMLKETRYGKRFHRYSLEMAALPVSSKTGDQLFGFKECGPAGPVSLQQRKLIHNEVFGFICGELELASSDESANLKVTVDNPLHLEIDVVSPLRLVLLASVAFHEHIVKPGSSTSITLSLLSQLPHTVEIDQLEVQFNQSDCNFIIVNSHRHSGALVDGHQGHRVETASSLSLSTNRWLRLTYDVKSDKSGKLECISVIAKLAPHFTICCRAESPASMDELPLWKFEDRVETYPTKDPALAFSGQRAIQVEEPESQVDLNLGLSGPAFVGESFLVPVTLASKGHAVYSGELKINLVDVRGGGLISPSDTEPFSMDTHHVQLLGISEPEGEDESQQDTDKIKKIQESFGLVSVPFLKCGESWSCKLEIKWHRPKPVMLYVSLGYSPDSNESTAQKVNIHKSLQIDGKTAIMISHRLLLPFRQDPLLPSRIKPVNDTDQSPSLPSNETSILIISAKNCTDVPLRFQSMSLEVDGDDFGNSCSVQHGGEDLSDPALVVPGEEFKKVFSIIPKTNSSKIGLGNVCLRWRRDSGLDEQSGTTVNSVLTKQKLPDVNLEVSPLVLRLDCPPYAILGEPFTYFIEIQNQTQLLQEVKFSLADAQSFVMSGSHNDTVFVLPKSVHVLSYKLVPLASGVQQLPRFTLTSVRYSAGFQPSIAASTLFVFPSKPHFKMIDVQDKRIKSLATE